MFHSVKEAIQDLYGSVQIVNRRGVAGGDINKAFVLELSDGSKVFMKQNRRERLSFFAKEIHGLQVIRDTKTLSVPEVYGIGTDGDHAFLLMEYIEPQTKIKRYWEDFGTRLAAMHKVDTSRFVPGGTYGFFEDNYIGAGIQINTSCDSWIEFFRTCRLLPQWKRAAHYFQTSLQQRMEYLLAHLSDYLIEPSHPSLLHGDLWAGNFMTGSDGKAWLIDPACYVGCHEADLAMTELFGGYPPAFYKAYFEAYGWDDGYPMRKDLYNLYHLLNHLNLFGPSYQYSVLQIINKYTKQGYTISDN